MGMNRSVVGSVRKLEEYGGGLWRAVAVGVVEAEVGCLGCQLRVKVEEMGELVKVGVEYDRKDQGNAEILLQ